MLSRLRFVCLRQHLRRCAATPPCRAPYAAGYAERRDADVDLRRLYATLLMFTLDAGLCRRACRSLMMMRHAGLFMRHIFTFGMFTRRDVIRAVIFAELAGLCLR